VGAKPACMQGPIFSTTRNRTVWDALLQGEAESRETRRVDPDKPCHNRNKNRNLSIVACAMWNDFIGREIPLGGHDRPKGG
jgi:hypothetical protein